MDKKAQTKLPHNPISEVVAIIGAFGLNFIPFWLWNRIAGVIIVA